MTTGSGDWVGAFLVWFRLPHPAIDWNGSQVTSEIAYDAAGHVIARHGPLGLTRMESPGCDTSVLLRHSGADQATGAPQCSEGPPLEF